MVDIPISILMHPNVLSMEKIAGSIRFAPMDEKDRIFLVITPDDVRIGRMVCEIQGSNRLESLFHAATDAVATAKNYRNNRKCP